MKLFTATVEIGTTDNVTEENLKQKLSSVMEEHIPEIKLFRINKVEKRKVASGEYKLNLEEARRLGLRKSK